MKTVFLALILMFVPPQGPAPASRPAAARPAAARPGAGLEITLERKLPDNSVQPVASDHVFDVGDIVHFRVKSDFDGYLYVMDQGTSGRYATVWPSEEPGADNRLRKGQTFSIPSGQTTWFQIDGPAGFDTVYFLLSPAMLGTPAAAAFASPGPVSSLIPRCNDAIFKARGECTDINAGPAPLPRKAPLPAPLVPLAGMASRDIKVIKQADGVTVDATGDRSAPVIYTFRLAHR